MIRMFWIIKMLAPSYFTGIVWLESNKNFNRIPEPPSKR